MVLRLPSGVQIYYVYFLLLLSTTWLGTRESPLFFSLHLLLLLLKRSTAARDVLWVFATHGDRLALVALLGLLITFLSTAVSYQLLPSLLTGGQPGSCPTLLQSFTALLIGGTRSADGQFPSPGSSPSPLEGVVGLLFRTALPVAAVHLLYAVFLDALLQQRNDRDQQAARLRDWCFICGRDRGTLDRVTPGGFHRHIATEHNLWNYVSFLQLLATKDPDQRTGPEAYVWGKLQQKDVTFFPFLQPTARVEGDAESQTLLQTRLASIEANVAEVHRYVGAIFDTGSHSTASTPKHAPLTVDVANLSIDRLPPHRNRNPSPAITPKEVPEPLLLTIPRNRRD
eukprot:GGOE01002640.1.p1 GENE.GGOE01002640.1~~GGOE01002640.1.p1  ORF type:complete len:341 (-),score=108.05 GGOE01002640.1:195-1217(-)